MPKSNGVAARKCASWIETFVQHTAGLETPEIFRRWAAITAIGAVLEQRVWIKTTGLIFPNIYTVLVGHPGVGKTRTVRAIREYLSEVPEFHVAPTSLTSASLVDALVASKCIRIEMTQGEALDYHSMTILADELGTFMHEYSTQMVSLLSSFYDTDPYAEQRRTRDTKITIHRPQISMLCGTTPSNLMKFVPEYAWDQGFTSRIILVWSEEKIVTDIFAGAKKDIDPDLVHDLLMIQKLRGEFKVDDEFAAAVFTWRKNNMEPEPKHPKLLHYNTRRMAHLLKLSMISSVDRGGELLLTIDDYKQALKWLLFAEVGMEEIFKEGSSGADSKIMDEIEFFVRKSDKGEGVPERLIIRYACSLTPSYNVERLLALMVRADRIKQAASDKQGKPRWTT